MLTVTCKSLAYSHGLIEKLLTSAHVRATVTDACGPGA